MDRMEEYTEWPKRYFNVDGLGEAQLGLMMLALASLGWLCESTRRDSIWNAWYGRWAYHAVLFLILHYGAQAIKKRVKYLRTGFVKYPPSAFIPFSRQPLTLIVIAVTFAGAVAALVFAPGVQNPFLRPRFEDYSMAFVGAALEGVYASTVTGRVRWKKSVAVIMVCGALAISMFSAVTYERWLWLMGFFGATFLISGGISFCLYLKHAQPAARTAE